MKFAPFSLLFACLLISCQQSQVAEPSPKMEVQYLNAPGAPPTAPYSELVKAGNTLYLAGKIGRKASEAEVVPGGIQAETRQCLENIKDVLERNGASMDDIVKCTVFLTDISEWGQMNEVYKTYFKEHFPARSAVGVQGLAKGARVEIECIAVVQ